MPSSPISLRGKRLAILLAVGVYLPLIYNALFGPPAFVAWRINEFWRFTELFPYRTVVWPVHQVFVQGADGEWRQVPQAPLFRHNLFGRMTRMDMLQLMLRFRRTDDPTTRELKKSVFAKVSSWPPVDYSNLKQETTFEYRKQPSPSVR